ncbi:MAG: hypothetical protein PHN84_13135 [Desulfuromonadaceae bacterium]|nr:hypothetical protein [Desulfuromonadaceae bacterium]MDD2854363.1 hypothetical protein [Desulfuromonadaceae bacterium]
MSRLRLSVRAPFNPNHPLAGLPWDRAHAGGIRQRKLDQGGVNTDGLTNSTTICTFISTEEVMTRTLPIMEARKQLTSLPELLVHNGR